MGRCPRFHCRWTKRSGPHFGAAPEFSGKLCDRSSSIESVGLSLRLLFNQPRVAIFPDEGNRFFPRVYAMRDTEIDLARELVSFLQHRVAAPFHELGPHFTNEDERRVVELAHLKELPHQRQFQKRSNPTGNYNERVGNDHEMMEPREEGGVLVGLADERIYFL